MKHGNNEFKKLRVAAGLSQRDVSNSLGYNTPQFISNWERCVSSPPYSAAKKLSKLYNVPLTQLVTTLDALKIAEFELSNARQKKKAGL